MNEVSIDYSNDNDKQNKILLRKGQKKIIK